MREIVLGNVEVGLATPQNSRITPCSVLPMRHGTWSFLPLFPHHTKHSRKNSMKRAPSGACYVVAVAIVSQPPPQNTRKNFMQRAPNGACYMVAVAVVSQSRRPIAVNAQLDCNDRGGTDLHESRPARTLYDELHCTLPLLQF